MIWKIFLIVYAIMSLITLFLYAVDKRKAKKHRWRIPERTLILFSFLFGSLGALLGMFWLRHKTQHKKFLILVPLSFMLHVALFLLILIKL